MGARGEQAADYRDGPRREDRHDLRAGHQRRLQPLGQTVDLGQEVLFEAGQSFLGLGDPNQMSWGLMIGSSRQYVLSCWWAVAFPGAAIFLTVLAVSLIGDGLNDALNPKLRER